MIKFCRDKIGLVVLLGAGRLWQISKFDTRNWEIYRQFFVNDDILWASFKFRHRSWSRTFSPIRRCDTLLGVRVWCLQFLHLLHLPWLVFVPFDKQILLLAIFIDSFSRIFLKHDGYVFGTASPPLQLFLVLQDGLLE